MQKILTKREHLKEKSVPLQELPNLDYTWIKIVIREHTPLFILLEHNVIEAS